MQTIADYIKKNLRNPRVLKFAVVGGSGVLVNMGVLYLLTHYARIHYMVSSVFAIEFSILTNFLLNNYWTWRDRMGKSFFRKFLQYHISVGVSAVLANWLLLVFLTEVAGIYYLISNLIGIGVGMLFNFVLNDLWTFRQRQ